MSTPGPGGQGPAWGGGQQDGQPYPNQGMPGQQGGFGQPVQPGQHPQGAPIPQNPGSPGPQNPGGVDPQGPGGFGQQNPGGFGPQGPGGMGPQGPDGQGPNRRRWGIIAVAFGCAALLILVIAGIGVGVWALNRPGDEEPTAAPSDTATPSEEPSDSPSETDEPSDTASAEGGEFVWISPYDGTPGGTPEELTETLSTSPLTTGSLPSVSECELPGTPKGASAEELQATLRAGGTCLDSLWATASSDRGLPWVSPTIMVYTYPDIPETSSCEADSFSEDAPRMCNLDQTLYWPLGYGDAGLYAESITDDPAEISASYLWDLSYQYMSKVAWESSIGLYYLGLDEQLEGDESAQDDAWRRHSAMLSCLGTAASMRLPAQAQPPTAVRDALSDPDSWTDARMSAETRAHWIEVGFGSDGDMAACNAWDAPDDQVT